MASILATRTVEFPLRLLEEDSALEADPTAAVLFFGISLVLGIACRHALRGTRVPYTVALLLLGIGLGALGLLLRLLYFIFSCYIIQLCNMVTLPVLCKWRSVCLFN